MLTVPSQPQPLQAGPLAHIPQWFVAIAAFVYFAGYLIETIFYSSIGINDASAEIFKLKYIQTGLHFLILLLAIIVPLFLSFGRHRYNFATKSNFPRINVTKWGLILAALDLISLYFATLFTPVHYFQYASHQFDTHGDRFFGIFCLAILVWAFYFGISFYLEQQERTLLDREMQKAPTDTGLLDEQKEFLESAQKTFDNQRKWSAQFLSVIVIALDVYIFYPMSPAVVDLLWPYGIFFFAFAVLIALIGYRLLQQLDTLSRLTDAQAPFRRSAYVSIMSFGF